MKNILKRNSILINETKFNYASLRTVIVKKDVENLLQDDIVKVKSGYMRNTLFPKGFAIYATKKNVEKHSESLTDERKQILEEKKRGNEIKKIFDKQPCLSIISEPSRPLKEHEPYVESVKPIKKEQLSNLITSTYSIKLSLNDILYDESEFSIDSIGTYQIVLCVSKYQKYNLLVEVKTKQCVEHFAKLKQEKENSMDVQYLQSLDEDIGNQLKQDIKQEKAQKMKESEERMQKRKEKLKRLEERRLKKMEKESKIEKDLSDEE
eukprot:gene2846-4689_t